MTMSTDKQYLRQLSEVCRRPDAYARLETIDARLESEGADERTRMMLLEGIVSYVSRSVNPEAENWQTIDAYVALERRGLNLVTRLTFVVASPTRDSRSKPTDNRVPTQELKIEDMLTEGQYE